MDPSGSITSLRIFHNIPNERWSLDFLIYTVMGMQHRDLKEWDPDRSLVLIMKRFDLYSRVHRILGII